MPKTKAVKAQDFGGPSRAKSAYAVFGDEKRKPLMEKLQKEAADKGETFKVTMLGKAIGEMWGALTADDKKPYEETAKKSKAEHGTAQAAWEKTDSYKEFKLAQAKGKKKDGKKKLDAKLKEAGMPKKALSAYFAFGATQTSSIIAELSVEQADGTKKAPDMKTRAAEIKKRWDALPEADKTARSEQYAKDKAEYETAMAAFKQTDAYKQYEKDVAKLNKTSNASISGLKKRKGNDGAAVEEEEDEEDEDDEGDDDEEEDEEAGAEEEA